MSFLKKLFGGGGGSTPSTPAEVHDGFTIFAEPLKDGGTWRIAARIEKEIDGEVKTHQMTRADTLQSHEEAVKATLAKAKMLIDQQGETIFR
ncbi:HlyU family transcriptional regulator [Marivita sp. S6314]|uniref:HlyU family transcriptional regulator n=1 Tax=Marivita sp. S6314 TaxID=2926406 RepID=UPI001FF3E7AB|nr:HlyU family transcriptional regulator [Marivita sp. S6314]MCK0150707.1 HlyU family transcriptional regulator [Marivita sp. S6314]